MTTQHTGNEEEEIQRAESTQVVQNTEQSADDQKSEVTEPHEPEPPEIDKATAAGDSRPGQNGKACQK